VHLVGTINEYISPRTCPDAPCWRLLPLDNASSLSVEQGSVLSSQKLYFYFSVSWFNPHVCCLPSNLSVLATVLECRFEKKKNPKSTNLKRNYRKSDVSNSLLAKFQFLLEKNRATPSRLKALLCVLGKCCPSSIPS